MIDAKELARNGCRYLGTPYSVMDCQKLFEQMLKDFGLNMDLGGSNSWYRYIMDHGWVGTPEECRKKFGYVPQGATLFIREEVSDTTPAKFRDDGIGDITHMGVDTGLSGNEMVRIAEDEYGVSNASNYNFGNGAIHSSSSRGGVCTSKFEGETIKNGGWNRVGLFLEKIEYPGISGDIPDDPDDPKPEPEPEPIEEFAEVWSENGKPVNTRKGPDESYALSKAGKISVGTVVEILDRTTNDQGEEWCKIKYQDPRNAIWYCWMKADFLIPIDDSPTDQLYTVMIPMLTEYQADALISKYPGSTKIPEGQAVG